MSRRRDRPRSPAEGVRVSVVTIGDEGSACLGKEPYSSAPNAQNGVWAWSLKYGVEMSPDAVVYPCRFCDWWHTGRSGGMFKRDGAPLIEEVPPQPPIGV